MNRINLPALLTIAICLIALQIIGVTRAYAQTAGTITFAVEVTTAANGTVTPKATWSTTPAATSCTGFSGWSGTKAGSGSEDLAPVSVSTVYGISCTWANNVAKLTWVVPSQNTDGSSLTDLKGYRLSILDPDGVRSQITIDGGGTTHYDYTATKAGNWTFNLSAVTLAGVESVQTNPVTWMSGTATGEKSVTLAVNIPMPPTDFRVQ